MKVKMNKNIRNALTLLLTYIFLFACGIILNIYVFKESMGFALCGVLATLITVGFAHLVADNKKK